MFTGIIKDLGTIEHIKKNSQTLELTISTKLDSKFFEIGASVACNGCCLTVTNFQTLDEKKLFKVDIGKDTLNLTCFDNLVVGSKINLEPALRVGDSMGGHYVTGHIDTLIYVNRFIKTNDDFFELQLSIPEKFERYIVEKGSIAILGISLTIQKILKKNEENLCVISVMIIPHTFRNTILQFLQQGSYVEVEFDSHVKTIANQVENVVTSYLQKCFIKSSGHLALIESL